MVLCGELADELAFLLHLIKLLADHLGEELLGLDEGHLDIAVRVAVQRKLAGDTGGQGIEGGEIGGTEVCLHVLDLVFAGDGLGLVGGEGVVELSDEFLDGGDELDESLRNDDGSEVVTACSTCGDGIGDVSDDLVQALLLGLDLFGDEADVRLGLEGALKGDVGGAAPHHLDEMPVLAGGVAVALDVADELAVGLAGGVEAEGSLDLAVLEVAVDGLGASDDLDAVLLGGIVLGEYACVGVGVGGRSR